MSKTDTKKEAPKGKAKGYVFLKTKTYVGVDKKDDQGRIITQREDQMLDAGFYQMDIEKFPSLKVLSPKDCEVFDEVPEVKLAEIARYLGVDPDKHKKADDLLEVIVKEPKVRQIKNTRFQNRLR